MTAAAIIESATAEGLMVSLSPTGKLKVTGGRAALDHWQPLLNTDFRTSFNRHDY